jgi:hypothetical protein
VILTLLPQVMIGKSSQFIIDERHQAGVRVSIATTNLLQNLSDIWGEHFNKSSRSRSCNID